MLYGKTPWSALDKKSLFNNINYYPIKFHYSKPISEISKDFLRKACEKDEAKRMSWDELFKHPINTCNLDDLIT